MISRRTFLTVAGGVVLARTAARAQDPSVEAPADRLQFQGIVQPRAVVTAADNDRVIQALERRLKCTCGCNLDVFTCRTTDFTCTTSPAMHREVMTLYNAGKTPEEIIAVFVEENGEAILMAPPPQGFNLAGYLVPGLAIAAAGTLLAAILVRRQRLMPAPVVGHAASASHDIPGATTEDLAALDRALSDVAD